MKARILTGVIGVPFAAAVIIFAPPIGINFAVAIVCAIAVWEILKSTRNNSNKWLVNLSVIFAACAPFFRADKTLFPAFVIILAYLSALVILQIMFHETLKIKETAFAFFATVSYSIAFSCISYMRILPHGKFYIALGFTIPWLSDIGAYFAGTFFGKHKLAPTLSPNKTVEGFIGGIITSVLSAVIVAVIYDKIFIANGADIWYLSVVIMALIGAPLSVLGDLFASVIKREYMIKDYGNIFPGHGGVMDRFDSLLLCMPLIYLVVLKLPFVK